MFRKKKRKRRKEIAGSKSKKVTLKQKHKVIREVKEHHTKKEKDAKKLGHNCKARVEKDSGISSDLKALETQRACASVEIEQKKVSGKERDKKRKLRLAEVEDSKTKEVYEHAKRGDDTTRVVNVRDNSDKAFYKELVRVIGLSDGILEVLDARDRLGMGCTGMERMVRKAVPKAWRLLLLKVAEKRKRKTRLENHERRVNKNKRVLVVWLQRRRTYVDKLLLLGEDVNMEEESDDEDPLMFKEDDELEEIDDEYFGK